MFAFIKILCIAIYTAGIASAAGALPPSMALAGPLAIAFLAVHVLETLVFFKAVKRYPGSLAASIFLNLMFGLGHWGPLRERGT